MASRDERRLHNNKAEQIVVKKGHPTRAEAFEGNITLRYIENKGLFLYSYFKSRWYRTELTLDNPTGKKLEKSLVVKSINIIDEIDLKKTRVKGLVADEIEDGLLKSIPVKTKSGLKINDNFKIDGDVNPKLSLGLNDKESLEINTTYDTSENLSEVNITTITSASSPNLVLDIAGDIELNADGGQVTIKDATASHFLFDCDNTMLRIYDDTDNADYFDITVAANGATTLQTVDAGAAGANLTMTIDGALTLDSAGETIIDSFNAAGNPTDGTIFKNNGTAFGVITTHNDLSTLLMYEAGGASTSDYFLIQVAEHGATELITVDAAAAAANFKISADGIILLNAVNKTQFMNAGTLFGEVKVDTTSQFVLYEQGGATSNDSFTISCATHGATTITTVDAAAAAANLTMTIDGGITLDSAGEIVIDHTDRFKFKKAGTEYIKFDVDGTSQFTMFEQGGATTNDFFKITTATHGETTLSTVDANAKVAHINIEPDGHVEFDGCGVGFDLVTPTYNASDTDVDFTTGNKQFVTFGAGNITDLNLIFPKTSGNFTLLLKQDGTGSRTVTNYKAWDIVNSDAASGSATVKFPAATNPTLTTAANHVDILSFFYDADNQIAYGVVSLDFQD